MISSTNIHPVFDQILMLLQIMQIPIQHSIQFLKILFSFLSPYNLSISFCKEFTKSPYFLCVIKSLKEKFNASSSQTSIHLAQFVHSPLNTCSVDFPTIKST